MLTIESSKTDFRPDDCASFSRNSSSRSDSRISLFARSARPAHEIAIQQFGIVYLSVRVFERARLSLSFASIASAANASHRSCCSFPSP